jgi:Bromodomain extra-terminal - transcription regulation
MSAPVSALQRLLRVLEIVAKSSAPPVNEDGEAEVDIDALDNATLLELEEYVNSVLDVRFGSHNELFIVCAPCHNVFVTSEHASDLTTTKVVFPLGPSMCADQQCQTQVALHAQDLARKTDSMKAAPAKQSQPAKTQPDQETTSRPLDGAAASPGNDEAPAPGAIAEKSPAGAAQDAAAQRDSASRSSASSGASFSACRA